MQIGLSHGPALPFLGILLENSIAYLGANSCLLHMYPIMYICMWSDTTIFVFHFFTQYNNVYSHLYFHKWEGFNLSLSAHRMRHTGFFHFSGTVNSSVVVKREVQMSPETLVSLPLAHYGKCMIKWLLSLVFWKKKIFKNFFLKWLEFLLWS